MSGRVGHCAGEIIAKSQVDHDQKPDETCGYEDPGAAFTVADVHKIENHKEHFGDCDGDGSDGVEWAKIEFSNTPSDE